MKSLRQPAPRALGSIFSCLVVLALTLPGLRAADITWSGAIGDWNTPSNWGGTVPGLSDDAAINNGGTAQLSGNGSANSLTLGNNDGENGALQLSVGANLTVANTLNVGGYTGTGTGSVTQTGGSLTADTIRIGVTTGSSGTFALSGGSVNAGTIVVGDYGAGNLTVSGPATIAAGGSLIVASKASGTLGQNGGTVTVGGYFGVATTSGSITGTYNLTSGTLIMATDNDAELGSVGQAHLNLGSAAGGAVTISQSGGGAGRNLTVRADASAAAQVNGYGTVGLTGNLTNNGRVVADGYSTADRTLDLASFSSVANDIENPVTGGTNGWFAQNRGRLTLAPLAISAGDSAQNWGESSADAMIDLINSARLVFNDISTGGTVALSLLASDRGDIPAGLPGTAIGLWQVTTGGGFAFGGGNLTATFRFDDLAAGSSTPQLFAWNGGSWADITASLDTTNKLITSQATDSTAVFAVVVPEPASATLCLVSLGGLMAFRRIRRGGRLG